MRSRLSTHSIWRAGALVLPIMMFAAPVQAAEVNATNDPTHVWGAPILAVNPKNPNNIVLLSIGNGFTKACAVQAATDPKSWCANMKTADGRDNNLGMMTNAKGFVMVAAFTSFDSGKTWKRTADVMEDGNVPVFPPNKYRGPAAADANGLTVTPNGTFYMAWDAVYFHPDTPMYATFGAIPISKSTDGGKTWSTPILTGSSPDGGRLVTDPATGVIYTFSSGMPGAGPMSLGDPNIRITKEKGHTGMSRHFLSSKDGVKWSKPHITGGDGETMTVSHGLLATSFRTTGETDYFAGGRSPSNNELCGNAPKPCVIFQTTKDNGVTWIRTVMAVPADYSGGLVAADPTKANHFAIAFTTNANSELHVLRTEDAGKTWKGPAKISAEPGKAMGNVMITYGPKGDLGLAWRSRNAPPRAPQAAPGATPGGGPGGGGQPRGPSNIFAALSKDGGASFSQPLKINSAESPAPPTDRPFALSRDGGVNIALTSTDAFFAWPDWRTGEAALFFNALKLSDFKR